MGQIGAIRTQIITKPAISLTIRHLKTMEHLNHHIQPKTSHNMNNVFEALSGACSQAIAGLQDGEGRRRRDLDGKRRKHAQKGPI